MKTMNKNDTEAATAVQEPAQGPVQGDSLPSQLKAYLVSSGHSQSAVAKALGISPAALSSWLSGQYKGDNAAIQLKVKRYLKREGNRSTVLQIPTVPTENYRYIQSALSIAQEEYDIAVITGAAGTGKTTAIRAYAQRNNALYIKAHRGLTMHRLFHHIGDLLGLKHNGGLAALCEAVTLALLERDTLLIIDEAEYLSDNSLELLRQVIHDDAHCGLALVGLPKLSGIIQNMLNDHEQLLSRVGVALSLEPIPRTDFESLMNQAWPQLPSPIRTAIFRASENHTKYGSSPSLRNCTKIMARMYRACAKSGAAPSLELAEEATRLIMTRKSI